MTSERRVCMPAVADEGSGYVWHHPLHGRTLDPDGLVRTWEGACHHDGDPFPGAIPIFLRRVTTLGAMNGLAYPPRTATSDLLVNRVFCSVACARMYLYERNYPNQAMQLLYLDRLESELIAQKKLPEFARGRVAPSQSLHQRFLGPLSTAEFRNGTISASNPLVERAPAAADAAVLGVVPAENISWELIRFAATTIPANNPLAPLLPLQTFVPPAATVDPEDLMLGPLSKPAGADPAPAPVLPTVPSPAAAAAKEVETDPAATAIEPPKQQVLTKKMRKATRKQAADTLEQQPAADGKKKKHKQQKEPKEPKASKTKAGKKVN